MPFKDIFSTSIFKSFFISFKVMAHHRYEEADSSEDCSDGETSDSSEEDEYDSAEDSAVSLEDFIAYEDEPLVTPSASKKKGSIINNNQCNNNNISDDDIIVTFHLYFVPLVREVASCQPKVGVKRGGRQIVYDSEDEEEDCNSKRAKPAPGYKYIMPIRF
jgi:hypothetical protein